ncbi:MAG: hypothetical protein TIS_01028 [Tissierella sp.]
MMVLKKISDRIYYLPSEQETDRPVLGYVKGDKYSLVVDAGNSEKHVKKFYCAIEEAGLKLPDYTAITHWHWDHTFGMHVVTGKTIAGSLTNLKLGEVEKWKWADEDMSRRLQSGDDIETCDRCIRLEYYDRNEIKVVKADIEFHGQIILDLGGVHCELREIEATHSSDSVLAYVPEERTVFIGDADCADYYNNNGKYDKKKLVKLIALLEEIDFDTYVLGHDEPQNKDEVIAYLREELSKLG